MRFLGLFIIACSIFAYLRKKQTRHQNNAEDSFLEKEQKANLTRRKDISGLPYITIPLDKFPIGICENDSIRECESTLQTLSDKKILNLGAKTNTELKLEYGLANLNILTEYEQNFNTLCQTLLSYATALMQAEQNAAAQTVLEYGIEIGSDMSQNFLLLADLYRTNGTPERISELIENAEQLDSLMKNSILDKLNQILSE